MTTIWAVLIVSAIFAAVNTLGFTYLADILVSLFDRLLGGAAYRSFRAKWAELARMRSELLTISAQDEFARWARLQRKIDGAQAEYEKVSAERNRGQMASKMKCSFLVRLVYYGGLVWSWWRLSGAIAVPVVWRLAGGGWSVAGRVIVGKADGLVASVYLFAVFVQALGRLFSLVK